jgi:hypothetical protein
MNASDALALLVRLGVPVLQTADAAVALGQSQGAANKTLSRLHSARRRAQTTGRLERFLTRGASLRLADVKRRLRFILRRGVLDEV